MKVLIVKGNKKRTVSKSMFENYYKNAGWSLKDGYSNEETIIHEDIEEPTSGVEPDEVSNDSSDEEWDDVMDSEDMDEEIEKPLSEMNNKELSEYAEKLGIDTTNLKSNKQLREAIKNNK